MTKRKPSGFVAICQCGGVVETTDDDFPHVAETINEWLKNGNTVKPMFGCWSIYIDGCSCKSL